MIRRISTTIVHDAVAAVGASDPLFVEDFRNMVLEMHLVGATGTYKVKVSNAESINFGAASTVDNPWYYADLKGLGDGATTVVGSTGITSTAETSQKGYAVNVDMARWVAVDVEAWSAGTVSAILSRATNG